MVRKVSYRKVIEPSKGKGFRAVVTEQIEIEGEPPYVRRVKVIKDRRY